MQKVIQLKFVNGTRKRKPCGKIKVVAFIADDAEHAVRSILFDICRELKYCVDSEYAETEKLTHSFICKGSFSINPEGITLEAARQEIRALFTKLKKRQQRY